MRSWRPCGRTERGRFDIGGHRATRDKGCRSHLPARVPDRIARLAVPIAAACALVAGDARAQSQQGLDLGVERSIERVTYHFDNPSTYDTVDLVPHFFEQHYILDNTWLAGRSSYRGGVDWRTEAAVTTSREALATDYDTFFNPGGVTWVAGTTGGARVRSFRVSQAVDIGRAGPLSLLGGHRLRADLADFLAGDRTEVRNGQLVARTLVTSREHTRALMHEVFLEAFQIGELSDRWKLRLSLQVSPAAIHRLSIHLPDKYPGRTLLYQTATFAAATQVQLTGGSARWPLTLSIDAGRTWRYRSTQWVHRSRASFGIAGGRRW